MAITQPRPSVQARHAEDALERLAEALYREGFQGRVPTPELRLLGDTVAYAREILDAGGSPAIWEPWPAGPHPDASYSTPTAWYEALDALATASEPVQEHLREATRCALGAALTAHAGGQDLSASVLWWLDKRERALRPAPAPRGAPPRT